MQRTNTKLLSPAQYAKARCFSPSTVSRQIRSGVIPTHNGLIDPKEADAGRDRNLDPARRLQAERRKKERKARTAVEPRNLRDVDAAAATGDLLRQLRLEALKVICSPDEALQFGRVMVRMGATRETAMAAGLWHICQPALIDALPNEDVDQLREPTDAEWREALGGEVNFEASDDLISHAVSEELQPDSKNFEAGTAGQGEKTKG